MAGAEGAVAVEGDDGNGSSEGGKPRDVGVRECAAWVDFPDGGIISRELSTSGESAVYFIGIIDILTDWTCQKSAENVIKTISHPTKPNAHSCVPPHRYATRFERALPSWIG